MRNFKQFIIEQSLDKKDDVTDEKETVTDKESDKESDKETDKESDKEGEDKKDANRDGLIRYVKNAHLVYKRKDVDGTYTELWQYKISKNFKDEFYIRNAILAGTDIDQKTGASVDHKQSFELWTNNNMQVMKIIGLPN